MAEQRTMAELLAMFSNQSAEIAEYVCKNVGGLPDLQCEDFPIQHTREVEVFVWIAFSSLIAVALTGNALVMYIIVHTPCMRHSFNYFLFNMALADFLMALLNTGTTWTYNFYFDWWYGRFCQLNHFFGVAPTCISVFTMMVVSHDRCMAIVDPLGKRAMSKKTALFKIAVIWIVAAVVSLPNVLNTSVETRYYYSKKSRHITTQHLCVNEYEYKFLYEDSLFVVQYAVPLLVLTYTFTRILIALRIDSFPSAARVSVARNHLKDKRKIVKMLALVVLIFMVCWLPYQIYHMFPRLFMGLDKSAPHVSTYCYLFFYWLAMSACMYNPIIYCVFSRRFRIGFLYAFRWLPCVHLTPSHEQALFPGSEFSRTVAASMRIHNKASAGSVQTPLNRTVFQAPSSPSNSNMSVPMSM